MHRLLLSAIFLLALLPASAARAGLQVTIGPTPIPRGNAIAARDITVSNDFFAVAFAVETASPWGVARGGIVDIAIVRDGEIGYDFASLADFMPNRWSSWPTSYQRVSVEKQTADEVIIRTERDWGEVELLTRFTFRAGSSKIHLQTRMRNTGSGALDDIYSGYVVWPEGGSLFGVPGLYGVNASPEDAALADWSASYDEHWVLGLHAPFAEIVAYDGRDRYLQHTLQAGESREFDAWLQIENDGSLAPLVRAEIEFAGLPSGRIAGSVRGSDGLQIARPAVVASRNDAPYAWTMGSDGAYEFELPVGDYLIYATAQGYAPGESRRVSITAGSDTRLDFADVQPPGKVQFRVADKESGKPLDARIDITRGNKALIGFFGKNTLFTELDTVGEVTAIMPPGSYEFAVSAAGGFTSVPQLIETTVKSGATSELCAAIAVLARPQQQGWYSADLHHHSDVLDGFTDPEHVLRSELAAGVDITFLSDHDSVINNRAMQTLSAARGVQFMPGTEMSPSWAHFNAYPVDDGKAIDIDTGQASVQEIFAAARRMGADVIEANHPYNAYGYFTALENNAVPGGYAAGFDLVEIVSGAHDDNRKTLARVWQMWNEGKRAYLAGGSDVHDVWLEASGSARTYVHVDGALSIDKFVAALKAGHAYASQGPLVFPEIVFGSEIAHAAGTELVLAYTVQAVSGLRSVQLIERGNELQTRNFAGENGAIALQFSVRPEADTWYSLVIEDLLGRFAYSNPVWVQATQ